MKASIEIGCEKPDIILESIKPEMGEEGKFKVELKKDNKKILLTVESEEISGLLAGINSYIKLIKTASSALEG